MIGALRAVVYTLIFFVLMSAGITVKDWQYWAMAVLLIGNMLTFVFED